MTAEGRHILVVRLEIVGEMRPIEAGSNTKLIAVIDDDPFVLEAMGGLLRKWGYEVLTAATDCAALHWLAERRRSPDLIVCDYHLSDGQTGIEVIDRLRGAFRIPAFLITADAAAAELAEAGGLDIEVVRKPADPKTLRAMLRQALGGRSRTQ
jgi:CheY-like chemotaxis protein